MATIFQLSERLSTFAPELTLDFISQVSLELEKAQVSHKAISLRYLSPWIKNLNKFCDPTSNLYELSGARLRDCVRLLLDLTVRDPDVCTVYDYICTILLLNDDFALGLLFDFSSHLARGWEIRLFGR